MHKCIITRTICTSSHVVSHTSHIAWIRARDSYDFKLIQAGPSSFLMVTNYLKLYNCIKNDIQKYIIRIIILV